MDYAHTTSAEYVQALFGTTRIPLPFTAEAQPATVEAHVQGLEPFCDVQTIHHVRRQTVAF